MDDVNRRSDQPGTALRASDQDRDQATGRLAQARALGYLTEDEFDQRASAALTARTVGELRELETDLPQQQVINTDAGDTARRRRRSRRGLTAHVGGYAVSVAIMLTIWVITAIAYGPYYFWPIWPILGGAMGVLGHSRSRTGNSFPHTLHRVRERVSCAGTNVRR